jgi:PPE-repeat protein
MTAPVWMAAPPEVHSALLSSGPGPGPLLASAGAWTSLSTEYASVADELSALVTAVQAGAWEGPTAEQYVAAHVPYVAWLLQASADGAVMAAQQEAAAAAYTAALTGMPTLAELAANHAIHAALVATNFFGINTIPIALNEADYVRMWIQAATTMGTYQAAASSAVAAAPVAIPAPQIVKSAAAADGDPTSSGLESELSQLFTELTTGPLNQFLTQLVNSLFPPGVQLQGQGGLLGALFPINPFTPLPPGTTLSSELSTILFNEYEGIFVYGPSYFSGINPVQLIPTVLLLAAQIILHPSEALLQFAVSNPIYLSALLPVLTAPVGAAGGFAGLAGLAGVTWVPTGAETIPVAAEPQPAVGLTPGVSTVVSPGSAPAPAPATAPAASGPPPPPPPPSPPPVSAAGAPFPYLVGGPSIEGGLSDQAKTHEPTSRGAARTPEAAATAAATQEVGRARRRRRAKVEMLGRGYEYMDLEAAPDDQPAAAAVASDTSAGRLGFAGTTPKTAGQATGLATLAGDAFGGGPRMPMMPGTWEPDRLAHPRQGGDDT